MDYKREFIKRAIDTTNGFGTFDSEATAVNPNIWDFKLREYEEENLVLTPQAEQFDFRGAGTDYKVTIDEVPSAAAALTETIDVPISSFTTRNTTFTPTEYGASYQLSRKEAVRAFFNVADRMVKKLGYSLALKKDNLAYAELVAGAENSVIANSKTALTALASTDTLGYAEITKAIALIEEDVYTPMDLFVSYKQKQDLLNLQTINNADKFGSRDAVARGLVGELFGLNIWVSHSITKSTVGGSNYYDKAVVLGRSGTGERAFGYAIKRDPMIEREYHARGRYWDIVAHEEYDFAVLHGKAICTIATYNSAV
jgi:N4-gp56 family major capsid protein